MPTVIGILTFMTRINNTSGTLKQEFSLIFKHFSFYEQLKIHAQLSMKKDFYNLRPGQNFV